jgi:hypothetical protein
MQLSQQAVDLILAVVAQFDRERGVPHDYYDLEAKLKGLRYTLRDDGQLSVEIPGKEEHQPRQVVTIDPKAVLLDVTKEW